VFQPVKRKLLHFFDSSAKVIFVNIVLQIWIGAFYSIIQYSISPSLIPQKKIMSRSFLNSGTLIVIISFCCILFQKSGTKSRGVLQFVPLRRFYSVLFIQLFCRPREKCGTLWKAAWLHNVDNIRQKDIKFVRSCGVTLLGALLNSLL
jgi:hypothetical protein